MTEQIIIFVPGHGAIAAPASGSVPSALATFEGPSQIFVVCMLVCFIWVLLIARKQTDV